MNSRTQPIYDVNDVESINDLIVDSIQDIKGKGLVKLDLRHLYDRPADFFIICEGESNTQIRAIANNVAMRMRNELDFKPGHMEGTGNLSWVLVDYYRTVVHVFSSEARGFYDLESLWGDGKKTFYPDMN